MKKLFLMLKQSLREGEDLVLVTVIASSGSTPRGAGARMLVNQRGRVYGTIGGGVMDYQALQLAVEILKSKSSYVKGYKLAPGQVEDLGMICGGDVVLYFQFITAADSRALSLVDFILALFDRDEDSWLIIDITDETAWSMGAYSAGKGIAGLDLEPEQIKPLLEGRAVQIKTGVKRYYAEPLTRAGKVIVFGGGHIAQELVPVLAHLGFRCLVMDDREEFANKDLFPMADEIIVGNFERIRDHVTITENDCVVVVTRGHHFDFVVQEQVLAPPPLCGVIGSRKNRRDQCPAVESGIPAEALERVYAPIGIPIKAETPAEIAISIAGELILTRARRLERTLN